MHPIEPYIKHTKSRMTAPYERRRNTGMNEKIYEFLDLARKSAGTARDAASEAS